MERKYWAAFNEELLGLPCLQAVFPTCLQRTAFQTLNCFQGTIFYDTGERYVEEDEEKIVLLPQAGDRERLYQLAWPT